MEQRTNGLEEWTPRRIAPVLNRLHREISVLEECTDALLEDAIEHVREGGEMPTNPLITGWSIRLAPDGRHHFVPFGNVRLSLEGVQDGWREPHLVWEVDEEARELVVEAELPGVHKEEIEIEVDAEMVRIHADGKNRRYEAELTPGRHLGKKCRARYEAGLLVLHVALAKRANGKSRSVKVKG